MAGGTKLETFDDGLNREADVREIIQKLKQFLDEENIHRNTNKETKC